MGITPDHQKGGCVCMCVFTPIGCVFRQPAPKFFASIEQHLTALNQFIADKYCRQVWWAAFLTKCSKDRFLLCVGHTNGSPPLTDPSRRGPRRMWRWSCVLALPWRSTRARFSSAPIQCQYTRFRNKDSQKFSQSCNPLF